MNRFAYHAPQTVDEACALLEQYGDDARLLAGGTALVILMKQELVQPGHLVDLRRVSGSMRGVEVQHDGLRIGALMTQRELEVSSTIVEHLPVLAQTLRKVATMRIRNMATLGGNLAHGDPSLDPPVALVACDALVRVRSSSGERDIPLDTFYVDYYETSLQPTEILTDVLVPNSAPRSHTVYLKLLPRSQDDYATVGVAARLTLDESGTRCADARVVLGAAGSTVVRARQAESVLLGQDATAAAFREAAAVGRREVDPLSDNRGSAEYKRDMAEVMIRRALLAALAGLHGS
ncbi:MAG TPA: xanthine dehydrogenase family protein subunit M [Chloroflexota bacterium]|nr:xanthine dehydrogenase family protein subunit M [Chloroflexota bacterium]